MALYLAMSEDAGDVLLYLDTFQKPIFLEFGDTTLDALNGKGVVWLRE